MLASLRSTAALLLGVLVCSVPIWGQVRPLPAKAIDIEYSSSLDRLVLISKAPDQLLIVDPATSLTGVVALPKEPLSLSVSPDGKYAAVGHDALISYINLSTAVTDKYLLVSVNTTEILLAANGWVHAFALDSYSSRSVNLSTGAETALDTLHWVSHPAIHPNGRWVYSTRDGLSPNDIHKGDISSGPYKRLYDSRYHGQFNMCGRIWFTKDGQRLFNSCSTLFRVSADQNSDLLYNGRFSAAVKGIQGGAHAATLGRIIVAAGGDLGPHTTATEIQFYDDKFLNHIGSFFLPGGWSGRQLFTDAAESRLYIVATDAAGNSGIYTVSLTPGATCNSTLGQNAGNSPADGGDVTVNVVASAGCVWQSSTNEPWINITNGGVAAGNATVKLTASPNLSGSPRSGSVTIAGRTYTVTQAAATATPVSPITSLALRPVAAE
ncbi:MAG TPA: BACON domain-containing protein, partial [Bryobacteraceae bacterium]|nr:BACON domain-containing protein [Bryobacteraceae bacterium]